MRVSCTHHNDDVDDVDDDYNDDVDDDDYNHYDDDDSECYPSNGARTSVSFAPLPRLVVREDSHLWILMLLNYIFIIIVIVAVLLCMISYLIIIITIVIRNPSYLRQHQ